MVTPFLKPANGVGDTPPIPYYVYCLVGISILLFGALYWAVWRVVIPGVFGFDYMPRKEVLPDGTYYTVVSAFSSYSSSYMLRMATSSIGNAFGKSSGWMVQHHASYFIWLL